MKKTTTQPVAFKIASEQREKPSSRDTSAGNARTSSADTSATQQNVLGSKGNGNVVEASRQIFNAEVKREERHEKTNQSPPEVVNPVNAVSTQDDLGDVVRANIVSQILASVKGEARPTPAASRSGDNGGQQPWKPSPVASGAPLPKPHDKPRVAMRTGASNSSTLSVSNPHSERCTESHSGLSPAKPCKPARTTTAPGVRKDPCTEQASAADKEKTTAPTALPASSSTREQISPSNTLNTGTAPSHKSNHRKPPGSSDIDANQATPSIIKSVLPEDNFPATRALPPGGEHCQLNQAITQSPPRVEAESSSGCKRENCLHDNSASSQTKGSNASLPSVEADKGESSKITSSVSGAKGNPDKREGKEGVEPLRSQTEVRKPPGQTRTEISEPPQQTIPRDSCSNGSFAGLAIQPSTSEIPQSLSADSGIGSPTERARVAEPDGEKTEPNTSLDSKASTTQTRGQFIHQGLTSLNRGGSDTLSCERDFSVQKSIASSPDIGIDTTQPAASPVSPTIQASAATPEIHPNCSQASESAAILNHSTGAPPTVSSPAEKLEEDKLDATPEANSEASDPLSIILTIPPPSVATAVAAVASAAETSELSSPVTPSNSSLPLTHSAAHPDLPGSKGQSTDVQPKDDLSACQPQVLVTAAESNEDLRPVLETLPVAALNGEPAGRVAAVSNSLTGTDKSESDLDKSRQLTVDAAGQDKNSLAVISFKKKPSFKDVNLCDVISLSESPNTERKIKGILKTSNSSPALGQRINLAKLDSEPINGVGFRPGRLKKAASASAASRSVSFKKTHTKSIFSYHNAAFEGEIITEPSKRPSLADVVSHIMRQNSIVDIDDDDNSHPYGRDSSLTDLMTGKRRDNYVIDAGKMIVWLALAIMIVSLAGGIIFMSETYNLNHPQVPPTPEATTSHRIS